MATEQVLIINNSKQDIDFLADTVLAPQGFQTVIAASGNVGISLAHQLQPDLILLSMSLSAMSGIEVMHSLNSAEEKIPVIVTAAQGSEALAVQAFRLGVKDYVPMPVEPQELLASIERALAESRLRRERDDLTARLVTSNRELEQRVKELNTLFGVGKSVTALLDHNRLLARLVEAAIYLTNAEEGSLMLVDPATDELYMVAARGIDERVARSFRLKVNDSLAGQVITTGQPLILTNQDVTKIKTSYLVRSAMYVPLHIKGRVRGILAVDNQQADWDFSNHHMRLLSTLADYAAVSLENAQLFNQVESERAKLAAVLAELEEPVIVVDDADHRILVANAAFRHLFNLQRDATEGKLATDAVHNPALLKLIAASAGSGQSCKDEILLSDGRTFDATLTPVLNVGLAIVMKDVTHFKELDRLKSEFVSTVSHDLRAPLTSIKDYARMLTKTGALNDRQSLFVNRITRGIEHVTALVDNLLDLSTIELGVDPNLMPVDINQLAAEVVGDFQGKAQRSQQRLVFHPAAQPVLVTGNSLRLKQVVSNLVENALKYTLDSGQISALLQTKGNQAILKVEDTGIGILPADMPFVFDKFFRAKPAVQNGSSSGTGLGLAICKSIIEKYGGHIWVESQPQQGSTFIVALPLADQPLPVPMSTKTSSTA